MGIFLEKLRLEPRKFLLSNKSLSIVGKDAQQYLHSQTTNDVKSLRPGHFQFNTILDNAGKIIAAFILSKESDESFLLIIPEDFVETLLARIEKYHISEEFEVVVQTKKAYLVLNHNLDSAYQGRYFFENDKICMEESVLDAVEEGSQKDYNTLKLLTGVAEYGHEVVQGALINNTIYESLAVDYNKGCYPGQETVAKIKTRRGAAYGPVLFVTAVTNIPQEKIVKFEGKKIGEVLSFEHVEGKTYLMLSLLRNYRVDKLEVKLEIADHQIEGQIFYYPYLSPYKKDLAQDLYDYALECFHQSQYEKAIEYFYKAIETDSTFEDAYEGLGVLYGRLEKYDQAIEIMQQLKSLNPNCMMAFTNLSLFHMKKGNIEEAEKYKADATLLNFQILGDEAQKKRQEEEIKQKKIAEMKKRESMFKQVLELDPLDAMANNGMGEILLEREEYAESQAYFRKAIESNSKYSVAYLGLAKTLFYQSKSQEAIDILEKGIKVAGKNGDLMPANEMQSLLLKVKK
ncbi:MAG: tetratricopeptide repeat protein [Bacteriovoracaceae bacterium]|jgi:folate-binding protein YgfZ|nr:tetratricopeptide repeat protein [Bacteriovoracaceae bacterium]